ncbi:MAG: M56 family metallopeptidase, partial [Candidatus Latescibacteria bacterium]|nr:M56 family metallopeptidase [Candidatus Latescibacterota bacterium]
WPLYAIHMVEVSLFIVLVWAVDHWLTLETRLRYALYLLALAKVFVPPVLAIPIPAFLHSTAAVTVHEGVSSGVVSEAFDGSPGLVTPFPPAFYLFCLWVISVLVWTGVALWKNMAFRRTLKSAAPVDLASDVSSLSVPGNLKVYAKTDLPSPILVGLIRPRLYLPSHWPSWKNEELRGVVKHELAHFERRDIYVLILQAMATALFGTNPLIWLLNRRLMYVRELRCDEAVLRETSLSPAEYGRLLLGLVDRRPMPSALTMYLIERNTTLKERLKYILKFKESDRKRSKWKLAVPVLIGLMIAPFSIREAYTQDDGGLKVSKSATDDGTAEITQPREVDAVSGHVDSNDVLSVVYDIKEVDEKPHPVRIFAPDYPEDALNGKIDGVILLKFIVNADGSVSDVTVLKGPEIFHQAAIDAALQWQFRPAMRRGAIVPAWITMPIGFSHKPKEKARSIDTVYTRPERAFELGAVVDVKPVVIHSVQPIYPDVAQEAAPEANVFLKFKVNVDGSVSDVRVLLVNVKGPRYEAWHTDDTFRRPAIDAISQYRFTPARHGGKPVPVWMTHRFVFELPSKKATPPSGRSDVGGDKVFEFWDVDVKPVNVNLRTVRPVYPDLAKEAGLTGNVFLKFKINVDGSASDVRVLRGDKVFHEPAIEAVRQLRYRPAEIGGKPVPVWMTKRIAFALPDQQEEAVTDNGRIEGNQVFDISDVHVTPVHLNPNNVRPDYPDVAKEAGLTGRVILKFKVNVDGSVSDVHVLEGDEIFRKPAMDAVAKFRYKPAQRDGNPVPVWITLPFQFVIPENQVDAVPETGESVVGN